jgi:predicted aspartyl protease
MISSAQSMAQEKIEVNGPIMTPAGLLSVRPGTESECRLLVYGGLKFNVMECMVMDLDGRVLFGDWSVMIDAAFPCLDDPRIVFATQWSGGMSCCATSHIVDFTCAEPILVRDAPAVNLEDEEGKIYSFPGGVTYQNYGEGKGPLGERLWETYLYFYGSGEVEVLRSVPKYSSGPMHSKKYPHEVLNDPAVRGPFLQIMSHEDFKELNRHIEVQSPLERLSDTIFVGRGCIAHRCCNTGGEFVIDVAKNTAWAMYYDETTKIFFGSPPPEDAVIRPLIEGWMSRHNVSLDRFVSNPGYRSTQTPEAGASVSTSEVPLIEANGNLVVEITVNGLYPLLFIVDSGASDVTVPEEIVADMIRIGALTKDDFTGTNIYCLADGSTVLSEIFRIKSLKIGDRVIENVAGSVIGREGVPLLGRSLLNKFQRWSINNSKKTLELEW